MPKTSVKIACHEPNDMPTLSATSLIVIQRLFKILFFNASMFTSVVDVLGQPERALSLICALFLKIALSAAELLLFGNLGAAI